MKQICSVGKTTSAVCIIDYSPSPGVGSARQNNESGSFILYEQDDKILVYLILLSPRADTVWEVRPGSSYFSMALAGELPRVVTCPSNGFDYHESQQIQSKQGVATLIGRT
jgi:hypothetical protein